MEVNPEISINFYKDHYRDHMIRNEMWDVFYLPEPLNKYQRWDLLLHQPRFPLSYVKLHINTIHKVSKADQCVFHNLPWSGVYLRSTLSNTLLWKVLTLVSLTVTILEVFFTTMPTFLSHSYDDLEDNLTHMKIIKLKSYSGENITDCCAAILLDSERRESAGAFNPEHLG